MNLIEKLCKELGVEIGSIWQGNDGYDYRIEKDGIYKLGEEHKYWTKTDSCWEILTGEVKPIWVPEIGDYYYIPCISTGTYEPHSWCGSVRDKYWLKKGIVFKTREEAMKMTEKAIKLIKEERENERN